MDRAETPELASALQGDKLYQQRARAALPILVRQAEARQTITYENLAEELGMSNPRTLNYPLGSVGISLRMVGEDWKEEIPPIQCLVIGKNDGLPGEGIGLFLGSKGQYSSMSKSQRRALVESQLQGIYNYPRWRDVLAALSLSPVHADFSIMVRDALAFAPTAGESEEHKRLKMHVAENPNLLGLPAKVAKGTVEYSLPSGDRLDILFRHGDEWVAAEIKSHISSDIDLTRGFFQCIKYRAVLEAMLRSRQLKPEARAILVTTRSLQVDLTALKNILGVEVIQIDKPWE